MANKYNSERIKKIKQLIKREEDAGADARRARHGSFPGMPDLNSGEDARVRARQLMIQRFHYWGKDGYDENGYRYTLSNAELKQMLEAELGNYMKQAQNTDAVKNWFDGLDSDEVVDFNKFINLVGALTKLCNHYFIENEK